MIIITTMGIFSLGDRAAKFVVNISILNLVLCHVPGLFTGAADIVVTASSGYDVQEGTNVTLTCKANVGAKPKGQLLWSYIIGNPASPQDISYQAVKGPLVVNETCSYTQVSTLQLTMKKMYNGVVLRCTLQQNGVSIAESYKQTKEFNVSYSARQISVMASPFHAVYNEGGPAVTLSCSAVSNPAASYSWVLPDGTVFDGRSYQLQNLQINDTGNYTCYARNDIPNENHTDSSMYRLVVEKPSPTATSTTSTTAGATRKRTYAPKDGGDNDNLSDGPSSVSIYPASPSFVKNEGDKLTIHCRSSCHPGCSYTWTKQGRNRNVSTTGLLYFSDVRASDAGTYTCLVRNTYIGITTTKSATITLSVRYGPDSVSLTPNNTTYTINEYASLNDITCNADCYPVCTYVWTKQGYSSQMSTTSVLSFEKGVSRNYAGMYKCIATNPGSNRQGSVVLTIHVRYGPDQAILVPCQTTYTFNMGSSLPGISCTSDCYPPCTSTWHKVGGSTSISTTNGSLALDKLDKTDNGIYICNVTNIRLSHSQTAHVILHIPYPPDVVITVMNEDPHDIILKCLADGEPPNYTFDRWIHIGPNGTTEIQRYTGNVKGSENMLVLKNVTYMDSGYYICRVSNGVSTSTIQHKEIHVADKPFVIQDVREFYVRQHENVSIAVRYYSSDVKENITWIKLRNNRNTTIKRDSSHDTSISSDAVTVPFYKTNITLQGRRSQLNIKDVYQEDYAKYEVHIANSVGEEVVMLVVKQIGPPEIPRNFAILQDSETTSSIRLAWFSGYHGGANQTFFIECKPKGHEWRECARLPGGKLNRRFQLTVDGLVSGSSYLFRIYSRNEYGNSTDKSQALLGKTTNKEVATKPTSLVGPAVGGGLGAAFLIVLVIVGAVFVKRRWANKAKDVPMQPQMPHDEDGSMHYDRMGTLPGPSAPYGILSTATTGSGVPQGDGAMPYERLGTQHSSTAPYEILSTATTGSGVPQGSGGNLYDALDSAQSSGWNQYATLDSAPDQTHGYASLQVDLKGTTSGAILYSNLNVTAD